MAVGGWRLPYPKIPGGVLGGVVRERWMREGARRGYQANPEAETDTWKGVGRLMVAPDFFE